MKGDRPVLCFIDETRYSLVGKLRKGETMSGEEVAKFIKQIKSQLPGCVKKVLFRASVWKQPCRFVAMRIPKELKTPPGDTIQYELFEDDRYTCRIFCSSLRGKAHTVITKYDKRAESLLSESQAKCNDI